MVSSEVVGKGYVFTKNREMTTIGAIFFSTCVSHKAAKSMAKLISQLRGDSQPTVCLSEEDGAIKSYPSTHGHQTGLRIGPERKQTVQFSAVVHTYPVGTLM